MCLSLGICHSHCIGHWLGLFFLKFFNSEKFCYIISLICSSFLFFILFSSRTHYSGMLDLLNWSFIFLSVLSTAATLLTSVPSFLSPFVFVHFLEDLTLFSNSSLAFLFFPSSLLLFFFSFSLSSVIHWVFFVPHGLPLVVGCWAYSLVAMCRLL